MLKCNIRGVENGYPLRIEASSVEEIPSEFDPDMARAMAGKINFRALISAATDLAIPDVELLQSGDGVTFTDEMLADEAVLVALHKILFDIHIIEGNLICPESGRKFPVKDGIPNMLLHEDEV
jgi:multifunctional methyltransferase subunit TRM112